MSGFFSTQGGTVRRWGLFKPDGSGIARITAADSDDEDDRRKRRVADAIKLYHGIHPATFRYDASLNLAVQPKDDVVFNYARIIIDKVTSGVAGGEIVILIDDATTITTPDGEGGTDETTLNPAQDAWDQCLDASGGMLFFQKLVMNGAMAGDAWAGLQQAPPEWDSAVRLVVRDPTCMSAVWSEDDCEIVLEYTNQWTSRRGGEALSKRQRIIRNDDDPLDPNVEPGWLIVDEEATDGKWTTVNETPWEYPWPPIIHAQHLPSPNEYYGVASLEQDQQDLQKQINASASNIRRILRYYAHPTPWGRMLGDTSKLTFTPGRLLAFKTPEAHLEYLTFNSDLKAASAELDKLVQALLGTVRIPLVALGESTTIDLRNGAAIRQAYAPFIELVETLRRTYGLLIRQLASHALAMLGYDVPLGKVHIQWPEVIQIDSLTEAEVALAHESLGASRRTLLDRLGYDADKEIENDKADSSIDAGVDPLAMVPGVNFGPPKPRTTSL